ERQPPKQLEHFIGINDLRIAAERSTELDYFFACWQLPGLGWSHAIIPDAVFSLAHHTFAVEFDRGKEGIRYFMRTKLAAYLRGLEGFPLAAVLIVTDRQARMVSLANMIADRQGRILYTTLDLVREHGILAPVFHRHVGQDALALLQGLWSNSLDEQRVSSPEVSVNQRLAVVTDRPVKTEEQDRRTVGECIWPTQDSQKKFRCCTSSRPLQSRKRKPSSTSCAKRCASEYPIGRWLPANSAQRKS